MDRNDRRSADYSCRSVSLSARRAWIEMRGSLQQRNTAHVALRKESVDRNGLGFGYYRDDVSSLSARRAWIEISIVVPPKADKAKSLSARRAWIEINVRSQPSKPRAVALRKESVDRNFILSPISAPYEVALRKESVDRNAIGSSSSVIIGLSLSARRAWIEIESPTDFVRVILRRSPQGERG